MHTVICTCHRENTFKLGQRLGLCAELLTNGVWKVQDLYSTLLATEKSFLVVNILRGVEHSVRL